MDILGKAITAFNRLLGINYEIVLGKKGKTTAFSITFEKHEFYHIAGLQYLTDLRELKTDRTLLFNRILTDDAFRQKILKSVFISKISDRINQLINLEAFIDSNDTIFKYNEYAHPFSKIQADFLLMNKNIKFNLFLFLAYKQESICFCRSFFSDNRIDYSKNQITMTLLYKKKSFTATSKEIILFDSISQSKGSSAENKIF